MLALKPRMLGLLLWGMFAGFSADAQSERIPQSLNWMRFYLRWQVDSAWTVHWEADNRRFFQPFEQHQLISHLHVHYAVSKGVEAWLGMSYSVNFAQKSNGPAPVPVPEIRPWQAVSLQQNLRKFGLLQRLRWEERFTHRATSEALTPGYRFAFRLRYAATLQYKLSKSLALKAGDEVMAQWQKNAAPAFDQNRTWGGAEFSWNRSRHSLELLYLWIWQQNHAAEVIYDRDVIRLTFNCRV